MIRSRKVRGKTLHPTLNCYHCNIYTECISSLYRSCLKAVCIRQRRQRDSDTIGLFKANKKEIEISFDETSRKRRNEDSIHTTHRYHHARFDYYYYYYYCYNNYYCCYMLHTLYYTIYLRAITYFLINLKSPALTIFSAG